ncbi:MAG: MBL fold metallo-hydrolase [Streptosporangiales bacterium]|nr:MBL fold metallo-hydrolase [Streptosporangiales bacterium]
MTEANVSQTPDRREPAQGSTYEVVAIRYGTRETSKVDSYHRYPEYGEPDVKVDMDYFFWVVRGQGRTIVIDTGFDPEVGVRRGRTVTIDPADALARVGVDPAQVDQVVVTHFHYDHIGNVDLFPRSEIVVADRELEFWTGPYATRLLVASPTESNEIRRVQDAARDGRVRVVGEQAGIAPGIDAIRVGGHTPGQLVLTVATEAGQAVIASDALHYYEEYELDRPFAILTDLEEMYRAYDTLRELAEPSGHALVAGHDPAVMTRFPGLSDETAEVAVRIA